MNENVRQTSIEAYREIEAKGLLSRMRWKVYAHLYAHGPMTSGELTVQLRGKNEPHPSYHRRLHELEQLGVAKRDGARACSITGYEAEIWDVTPCLPTGKVTHYTDRPTPGEFIEALSELRAVYTEMKKAGKPFSTNLIKVLEWIRNKYA